MKIFSPESPQDVERFIRFDWEVYRHNPCWVPPLVTELRKLLTGHGLFFTHTSFRLFAVEERGRILAKTVVFFDRSFSDHWKQKVGFFGFFEALPDQPEAVALLFRESEAYLKSQGAEQVWGPVDGTVANPAGLLTNAFNRPPCFMMRYNPSYYQNYLKASGYQPKDTLLAFTADLMDGKLQRKIQLYLARAKSSEIRIERFDRRRFREECDRFAKIYSETFKYHFGYTPQSEKEVYEILEPLRLAIDPDLIVFACHAGETVGFMAGLPDYNLILRRLNGETTGLRALEFLRLKRHIREARMIAMGVQLQWRGKGIAPLLTAAAYQALIEKGYTTVEYSWVHGENLSSQRVARKWQGQEYKRYRIYEKIIAGHPVLVV